MPYLSWILRAFWTLSVAGLSLVCILFWIVAYSEVLAYSMSWADLAEKKSQITTQIFSETRFVQIRYVLLFVSATSILGFRLVWRSVDFFVSEIFAFFENLHLAYLRYLSVWKTLQPTQKIIVWICFLVGIIPIFWRVCMYAYWVDEVFSYLFLVKRGVLVSLTYYPGPNNHVFFTAISAMSVPCIGAFIEPILLMRLWAFGGILTASWILFAWFLVRYGYKKACWVLLLFLFQSPVQMYGYLGRGYAWEMLFFLCAWIGFSEWGRQGRGFYLKFACVSSIVGFYTLPTFLYAFGGLVAYSWWSGKQDFKHFRHLTSALLATLSIVLLLYAPIILLNGWNALAGNSWLKVGASVFWQTFLMGQYGAAVISFWGFDIPLWATWLVWLWLFWHGWQAGKDWRGWIGCLFFTPILLLLYQQVLPPARVWSYGAVALAVVALAGKPAKYIFLSVFLGNFIFYWQFTPALPAHVSVAHTISEKNAATIFANEDTYQMFVRYIYAKQNKALKIYTQCEVGRQDVDICIFTKLQPKPTCFLPTRYELLLENTEVQVFRNKKGMRP